jgi:hypothetical protein
MAKNIAKAVDILAGICLLLLSLLFAYLSVYRFQMHGVEFVAFLLCLFAMAATIKGARLLKNPGTRVRFAYTGANPWQVRILVLVLMAGVFWLYLIGIMPFAGFLILLALTLRLL